MLTIMSDLSTIIPVTAVVTITLFGIKEFLEWRRRTAADRRKLQAIKKVLARDIELNYSSISNLNLMLNEIKNKKLSENAAEISITSRPAGGFVVRYDRGSYVQHGIRKDNFLKHLVDIASLDESFYKECESALNELSEAEHILLSLVHGPGADFPSTPNNYYEGLADYGVQNLAKSTTAIKRFYQICTGSELLRGKNR
ncbi:hypothetical protein [Comamonas testosteroni]|uniref:hypothetical protein n=1 Tax=Comamonas testosteroni TaxID=285 RepID=UPI0012FEF691|nr:hypothetical protein [Comamonas testosteroni]